MVTRQDDEHGRDDAKTSNDLARVAAQSAIIINGGAASATLAFVSSLARDGQVKTVAAILPWPLFLYSLGVFLAALSLLIMSKAVEIYMNNWLGDRTHIKLAGPLWWAALYLVGFGLVCFLGASSFIAYKLATL